MSQFARQLLEYHTTTSSSQIGFENLKRIHPSLTEDSIYGLAIMATNPALSQEERDIFMQCLKLKQMKIKQQYDALQMRLREREECADNI